MRRVVLVLPLLALAGCSLFGPAWHADVAVVSMRIEGVEMFETLAVFTIRIDNEEPMDMALDGSVHEIEIDGRRVGRGTAPDRIDIPRLGSVRLEVPVSISNAAVVSRLRDATDRRRFHYRVESTLYVLRGGDTKRVRISHDGEIDLRGL